ncbi:MAG: hypothetical protein ACE37N_01225 [Pseudohongiellaceae bacterium]
MKDFNPGGHQRPDLEQFAHAGSRETPGLFPWYLIVEDLKGEIDNQSCRQNQRWGQRSFVALSAEGDADPSR